VLLKSADEALQYPRGDIVLCFCAACGFIHNQAFDPRLTEYSGRYEETQGFSPTFQEFHRRLASELLQRHAIHNKEVLEIGCGKGEFLALLCDLGGNSGIGFDPSFDPERHVLDAVHGAKVVADFYSEAYSQIQADLVCCKMTLEHIDRTAEFTRLARGAMRPGSGSVLYFLVPEAMRILRDCAFEDIYYEHCSYFTAGSLARLFRSAGLEISRLETEYAGQYLAIEAQLAEGPTAASLPNEDDLQDVSGMVETFAGRCENEFVAWRKRLSEAAEKGSVALWGSGSKAVAFLTAVDRHGVVEQVVDINPHKQGYFMPGARQQIVSPQALALSAPPTVIVMNPVYRAEIGAQLAAMGLHPELVTL
jgi:SAM-dependent methyltransferase